MATDRVSTLTSEEAMCYMLLHIKQLEVDKTKLEEQVNVQNGKIDQYLKNVETTEKDFEKGMQASIQACKERDILVTEFKKLQELHTKQVKKIRET